MSPQYYTLMNILKYWLKKDFFDSTGDYLVQYRVSDAEDLTLSSHDVEVK